MAFFANMSISGRADRGCTNSSPIKSRPEFQILSVPLNWIFCDPALGQAQRMLKSMHRDWHAFSRSVTPICHAPYNASSRNIWFVHLLRAQSPACTSFDPKNCCISRTNQRCRPSKRVSNGRSGVCSSEESRGGEECDSRLDSGGGG